MSGDANLESIRQRRPALVDTVEQYLDFAGTKLDPKLVVLCRLRIGQIAGHNSPTVSSSATQAAGITDRQFQDLEGWRDSVAFDATEKACIEFAEYFCYSAQSVTDEHVAKVREHLSPEQVLALTVSFWAWDASSRLNNFLDSVKVS